MTWDDAMRIAVEVFPDWDEGARSWAIWNRSGFPCFWHIPQDGYTPEECLRAQLERYRDNPGEG